MKARLAATCLPPLLLSLTLALPALPAAGGGPACVPSATELCLLGARFKAELSWENVQSQSGQGTAVALADQRGTFSFLTPAHVEIWVSMFDGTAINNHFWVFYGALTDAEYTLTITDTDTDTGSVRSYLNLLGNRANLADSNAFPAGTLFVVEPPFVAEPTESSAGACVPDATTHCLAGGRFETRVT